MPRLAHESKVLKMSAVKALAAADPRVISAGEELRIFLLSKAPVCFEGDVPVNVPAKVANK